jgi:NadR type nicotinamide-nucleotide adenylyltransferase
MEKRTGDHGLKIRRVVLTGPECTGKTTLTNQLARHFNAPFVPEYARHYIAGLDRRYDYHDVLHIAKKQLRQHNDFYLKNHTLVFFDTYLIITKVWMDVVFKHHPAWIDVELSSNTIDLYLLCNTDIAWIADPVRENGGEMRGKLFEIYKNELNRFRCNYEIISGAGIHRLRQAVKAVDKLLHNNNTVKS